MNGTAAPALVDRGSVLGAELRGHLSRAADTFDTPLYVTEVAAVTAAAQAVEAAFPDPWVRQYSLKANDLPAIVALLADRRWGANVVSPGEWASARAAGVPTERTTFEGVGKTDADLGVAVDAAARGDSLRWLAVESADELAALVDLHRAACDRAGHDVGLSVLLRLNPDVQPETVPGLAVGLADSKFGLSAADVESLADGGRWQGGLRLRGIHVHMGSNLGDVRSWALAGRRAVELLDRVRKRYDGPGVPDVVDFGGGFPAYGGDPSPAQFAEALRDELDRAGLELPPVPAIEPGRVLVGAAGWLLSAVLHTRDRETSRQVVIDAGMTELIRPALYGSRHRISVLSDNGDERGEVGPVTVEGAVCESTDTFGVHDLPVLHRGDQLAVHEAGAYGASFSSRYNGRPPAPEVLLWPDGTLELAERTSPPSRVNLDDFAPVRGLDGYPSDPERSHP